MTVVTRSPSSNAVDEGAGLDSNPANAYASDNAYASTTGFPTGRRSQLYGTFGFDGQIPAGATITKVELLPEWQGTNKTLLWLYATAKVGTTLLTEHRIQVTTENVDQVDTFDVTAERSWTRDDLLDGTLKVRVGNDGAGQGKVDHIQVRVTYEQPPVELAGAIAASGTVAGIAEVIRELAGALAQTGTVAGDLAVEHELAGSVGASVGVAGAFDVDYDFDVRPTRWRPSPLMAEIERLDGGEPIRAGPGREDVVDTPLLVEVETQVPGGFGPGKIVLPRPDWFDAHEAVLLGRTRIYDEADRTVHLGRVSGYPQVGVNEISIEIEGMAKSLEDDETAKVIFADQDLDSWEGMSRARRIALGTSYAPFDATADWDPSNTLPALHLPLEGPWGVSAQSEGYYDCGPGLGWTKLYHDTQRVYDDANMDLRIYSSSGDASGYEENNGAEIANGSSGYITPATARRFAAAILSYSGAGGSGGVNYGAYLRKLTVYGTDLPLVGGPPGGLLVSDMAVYIVGRWGPHVEIDPNNIELSIFAVPHAVWREDTTAKEMLDVLALYGGNSDQPLDWGVYETFFLGSPGNYGNRWRMRRDQGTDPTDSGPDVSERVAAIKVAYRDGSDDPKSVGPPDSDSDYETMALVDPNESNPAVQLLGGEHRGARRKRMDMGITSQAGALLLGQLYLADKNRQEWRGDLTVKGEQRTIEGEPQPPYMMRAGDEGVVEDDWATQDRRIVGTAYSTDDPMQAKLTIGADPDRLDVMLAKAGIVVSDLPIS